jgi:hypothetical protein
MAEQPIPPTADVVQSEKPLVTGDHLEKGPADDEPSEDVAPRDWDPVFVRKTMRKASDSCQRSTRNPKDTVVGPDCDAPCGLYVPLLFS